MTEITLYILTDPVEIIQTESIQKEVWNREDKDIIPYRLMVDLIYNGCGVLFGATDGSKLVGFAFGILGDLHNVRDKSAAHSNDTQTQVQLVSLMMGVLPAYQNLGIGYRLKLAQREYARKVGMQQISWAYDPLISRNAWLSIRKLGGTARTYLRNYYGELGGLDKNLETDVLSVTWLVNSKRVREQHSENKEKFEGFILSQEIPLLNKASFGNNDLLIPANTLLGIKGRTVIAVEIPHNFPELKLRDLTLANMWRHQIRSLLEALFREGFLIVNFVVLGDDRNEPHSYYILAQDDFQSVH